MRYQMCYVQNPGRIDKVSLKFYKTLRKYTNGLLDIPI